MVWLALQQWKKLLFGTVFVVLINGCATVGPKFVSPELPPTGKATVYVYRQASALGSSTNPGIVVNGTEVLNRLPVWSWWSMSLEPGNYEIEPTLFGIYKKTTTNLNDVEAGRIYYLRLDVNVGYVGLKQISSDEALREIVKCYQIVDVVAATVAGGDSPAAVVVPVVEPQDDAALTVMTKGSPTPIESRQSDSSAVVVAHVKDASIPDQQLNASLPAASMNDVATPALPRLYVASIPADARVRVLNIVPKFAQGIRLPPGDYHIETSAEGYHMQRQWITLESGSDKTLEVHLVSVTPVIVEAAQPLAIFADPQKQRYADMLKSNSTVSKRDAAKYIIRQYSGDIELLDLIESELIMGYNLQTRDRYHVDAMAWLCRALGDSGVEKYRETLLMVSREARNRKIRGYAQKAL